jgi:hypothetical protein
VAGSEAEAALGRQVERLGRQVGKNDAQVRSLAMALQRLSERVATTGDPGDPAGEGDQTPELLPSWLVVTDFHTATAMVEALQAWLTQVYLRYPETELPTCWAWHPWVVEELWWLRNAWCDAYSGEKASWQKVGDWHDRQRPNVTKRLREATRRGGMACGLGRHVDPAPEAGLPLAAALPHLLTAWCSPERASWPPTPTGDQLAAAQHHDEAGQRRRAAHRR